MNDPKPISVSVWVYRGLMNAYPRAFRLAYGEAMIQIFRDLCLKGGKTGLVRVWGGVLLDYAVSLISEHTKRGAEMTRAKWIQLSGWGLAASGFLLMAGFAASSRPTFNPYNAASWPIDPILNAADLILVVVAMLLMSAGMAGLFARFQAQASLPGKAGLTIGIIAGLVSSAGAIGLGFSDSSPWWELLMFGLLGVNLGLALFGINCWRKRLFSRWNGLLLMMGVTFLLFSVASIGLLPMPESMVLPVFVFFAVTMGLVGYRLQSEATGQQASLIKNR